MPASLAILARWAIKNLKAVETLGEQFPHNMRERSRLSSYTITDAQPLTRMTAGSNGSFFQMHGMDHDLFCPDSALLRGEGWGLVYAQAIAHARQIGAGSGPVAQASRKSPRSTSAVG
jgi:hypothetical protein